MCGICGVVDKRGRIAPIRTMNWIQRHRGPDDEGYLLANTATGRVCELGGPDTVEGLRLPRIEQSSYVDFNLSFGSRRLAIIDRSADGHQPMTYWDGGLWITFNGEIYNYVELRNELQKLGHRFATKTDTEVILSSYSEWGTDCLHHFNGMFAFALWDSKQRTLLCARDRMGIKPFYYFWDGTILVFASEIKALLGHPAVPRIPNDRAIFDYAVLGVSDHSEQTLFEGIYSLRPGESLSVDLDRWKLARRQWWDLETNPQFEGSPAQRSEVFEEFRDLLRDSIAIRLRSDVPIGSCLSGGLDSSAIVCMANSLFLDQSVIPAALVGEHQRTFTARYLESEVDEHEFSELVIQKTGAEENIVFPDPETLWTDLESFVWHMDEPVNSTSQFAQWCVMRLARERGVTVLLDGQGGDEILAGYYPYFPRYVAALATNGRLSDAVKAALQITWVQRTAFLSEMARYAMPRIPWHLRRALSTIWSASHGPGSALQSWQLAPSFLHRHQARLQQSNGHLDHTHLAGVLHQELTSTNLPKLLRYEDRNSMAFSREARLPFLDYRIVEFVFSLPMEYRIFGGWSKWILRKSMRGILPEQIRWRRSKFGFPTPQERWFAESCEDLRKRLNSMDADWFSQYLAPGELESIRALPNHELPARPGLWRIINLGLWFQLFFQQPNIEIAERLSQANRPSDRMARTIQSTSVRAATS